MRVRKVINRVYEGTVYYRWIISVPPKNVRELGWVDGQELETTVRGSTLWISPTVRARPGRKGRRGGSLQDGALERSFAPR